ncbi:MAG: AMP-binding protein, partial [Caulobacteraceae bacterium]
MTKAQAQLPPPYDPTKGRRSVFQAVIDARARFGANKIIIEDHQRQALTYTGLIRGAFALGRKIAGFTEPDEHVGVMLPSSVGGAVTFFALHAVGRVPVMLNFTSGPRNLKGAIKAAGVKTILSSKRFIAQARLEELAEDLAEVAEIVWLEDVRKSLGPLDKVYALVAAAMPHAFAAKPKPTGTGVILFTSGSFGAPKPVVLTHQNLVSNVAQTAAHIRFDPEWVFFNPLPIFHCFGLTGGTLLPVMEGLRSFQYPSPLHYKTIPALIKETGANVLLSTDTFMNQYARASESDELSSLKFVACG